MLIDFTSKIRILKTCSVFSTPRIFKGAAIAANIPGRFQPLSWSGFTATMHLLRNEAATTVREHRRKKYDHYRGG